MNLCLCGIICCRSKNSSVRFFYKGTLATPTADHVGHMLTNKSTQIECKYDTVSVRFLHKRTQRGRRTNVCVEKKGSPS